MEEEIAPKTLPEKPRQRAASNTPRCGCATTAAGGRPCRNPAGFRTDHPGQGPCFKHGGATPIKHGGRSRYRNLKNPRLRAVLEEIEANDDDPYDLLPEVNLLRALILDFADRHADMSDALIAWHASFGPDYFKALTAWQADYERWRAGWENWQKGWEEYRQHVEQTQQYYRFGWPEPPDVPDLAIVIAGCPSPPPDPTLFQHKPKQVTDILSVGRYISEVGALVERIQKMRQEGAISLVTLKDVLQRFGVEMAQGVMETVPDDTLRSAVLAAVEIRWASITLAGVGVGTRAGSRRGAG